MSVHEAEAGIKHSQFEICFWPIRLCVPDGTQSSAIWDPADRLAEGPPSFDGRHPAVAHHVITATRSEPSTMGVPF